MKKIYNIVMYKSIVDGKEEVKSCIFYNDGTIKEGSYADGIAAIKEITIERHITTKDALKEIVNKDTVYTMSEKEFINRYSSFLPKAVEEEIKEESDIEKEEGYSPEKLAAAIRRIENIGKEEKEEVKTSAPVVAMVNVSEEKEKKEETPAIYAVDFSKEDTKKVEKPEEVVYEENYDGSDNYFYENPEINNEEDVEVAESQSEEIEEYSSNNSGCVKVLAGTIVAGLIIAGAAYALTRCSKLGKVLQETTATTTNTADNTNESEYRITDVSKTIIHDNDLYDDYSLDELLKVTTNEFQKKSMINIHSGLYGFNTIFANKYKESGNDIKAALSFDEVVALQQAYNNYSVDEVRAYFNGYEVNAVNMSNAYKSASLQLMGAYVIETSKNPVDMSVLIDSQEGKDFYNRYHAMYLAAKEATGEEQLRLVKEFYAAVEKDFPITEEVRTEGISHSEAHNSLKDYQLAVAPMIASAEMIFQNLDVDYTLDDTKIDFLNDIGLCNHADDKFERLETITLTAYEDNTNPLYEQYKRAIIAKFIKTNDYVIDDAHRELTNLRRFQEVVNNDPLWKHKTTYEGEYGESYTYYEDEYTEVIEWEESTTEYTTVTTREEKPIPQEEKEKIDAEIEKENEEAKKKAEEEAEEERKRQQQEEDEKAKEVEQEVEEENKQLEEDIKEINEQIDENNKDTDKTNDEPVNENDYDHIDFDDEYTDDQGNLDGSVENVTTDGTGADEDLPDPNVTGQKFDTQATTTTATTETTTTETTTTETETTDTNTSETTTTETTTTETTTTTTEYTEEDMTDVYVEWAGEDGAYIEYDEDYVPYDADGNPIYTEESGNQKTR